MISCATPTGAVLLHFISACYSIFVIAFKISLGHRARSALKFYSYPVRAMSRVKRAATSVEKHLSSLNPLLLNFVLSRDMELFSSQVSHARSVANTSKKLAGRGSLSTQVNQSLFNHRRQDLCEKHLLSFFRYISHFGLRSI